MRLARFASALSFAAAVACTMPHSRPPNELIYGPAVVLAGSDQGPGNRFGVLVVEGKIAAVAPFEELRAQHPGAKLVDVGGMTILPGLTDAHGHLYGLGLSLDTIKLLGADSYDEVIARVKERAARAATGEWILGRGWDEHLWPSKQFP